jgi:hypothetical protein
LISHQPSNSEEECRLKCQRYGGNKLQYTERARTQSEIKKRSFRLTSRGANVSNTTLPNAENDFIKMNASIVVRDAIVKIPKKMARLVIP